MLTARLTMNSSDQVHVPPDFPEGEVTVGLRVVENPKNRTIGERAIFALETDNGDPLGLVSGGSITSTSSESWRARAGELEGIFCPKTQQAAKAKTAFSITNEISANEIPRKEGRMQIPH